MVKRKSNIKYSSKRKEKAVDVEQDKRLTKIEKKVKTLKPEYKYIDTNNTTDNVFRAYYKQDVSGSLKGLVYTTTAVNLVRGDAYNQRIGEKITPINFDLRMEWTKGTGSQNKARIIIFQADPPLNYPSGVPATDFTEIYKILAFANKDPYMLCSPYSKSLTFKYKVLYDKMFKINSDDNVGGFNHIRIPGKKMKPIQWGQIPNGTGGYTEMPTKNHIFMLVIDNNTSDTPENHLGYNFISRLTYSDA